MTTAFMVKLKQKIEQSSRKEQLKYKIFLKKGLSWKYLNPKSLRELKAES